MKAYILRHYLLRQTNYCRYLIRLHRSFIARQYPSRIGAVSVVVEWRRGNLVWVMLKATDCLTGWKSLIYSKTRSMRIRKRYGSIGWVIYYNTFISSSFSKIFLRIYFFLFQETRKNFLSACKGLTGKLDLYSKPKQMLKKYSLQIWETIVIRWVKHYTYWPKIMLIISFLCRNCITYQINSISFDNCGFCLLSTYFLCHKPSWHGIVIKHPITFLNGIF